MNLFNKFSDVKKTRFNHSRPVRRCRRCGKVIEDRTIEREGICFACRLDYDNP